MREASHESGIQLGAGGGGISPAHHQMRAPSTSNLSDAAPITRSSLAALTGDTDDLLSESPVFAQA